MFTYSNNKKWLKIFRQNLPIKPNRISLWLPMYTACMKKLTELLLLLQYYELDSLRWFSQCNSRTQVLCAQCDVLSDRITFVYILHYTSWLSRTPHFGELHTLPPQWEGGYASQIWTRPRFLCNAPTPKFHHPTFTCLEVIVLTNKPKTHKQTPPKTCNVLRYDTTLGNQL